MVKDVTDEEALQNFLEDPGLTWLMDQCESCVYAKGIGLHY